MAGGRKVLVPEMPDRGRYKPCTVRFLAPNKDEMQAHVGNEFITGLQQYDHIKSLLSLQDQLSYFLVLQAPEAGGELVLFDLKIKRARSPQMKHIQRRLQEERWRRMRRIVKNREH